MNKSLQLKLEKRIAVKTAFFFLLVFVFFSSCKKNQIDQKEDETESPKEKKEISSINVIGVENLIITDSENSNDTTNLKKITSTGEIVDIFYKNHDGTPANKNQGYIRANKIINISKDYIVIGGIFRFYKYVNGLLDYKESTSLLIRKRDGAIFEFGNFDFDVQANSDYSLLFRPNVFFDKDSNIFYKSYNSFDGRRSFTKISLENPTNLVKEDCLPSGQNIIDGTVDKFGNIAYSVNDNELYRLKLRSGQISFIQGGVVTDLKSTFVNEYWTGINGKMYISGYDKALPYISIIDTENGSKQTKVWEGANCNDYYPNNCKTMSKWNYMRIPYGNEEMIFINIRRYLTTLYIDAWRFNERTNQMKYEVITVPGITASEISVIGKSEKGVYFWGKGGDIYRYTYADNSFMKFNKAPLNNFEIYSIKIRHDDNLSIIALRFSDGKDVVAEIDNNGIFQVISDRLKGQPLYLERIN